MLSALSHHVSMTLAQVAVDDKSNEITAVETLLKLVPRISVKGLERNPMFERPDDAKRLIDGLRLAGLPE